MSDKEIFVTQPHLPPLEEFIPYLTEIWDKRVLTNGGPFHKDLEVALCEYLGVHHIALFANGTVALMTALQALDITGEVITTPYSFVATAHSLLWRGLRPVFVDVEPDTLNLDPAKVEAAITSETTAILPVHCYGNPCDVHAIQEVADRHNLKVIYDAAHAFGVQLSDDTLLNYGDLSVLSFHATKVFNTFEGGAVVCPDARTKEYIDQLKNFGIVDEATVIETGLNGKMSEFNAAFGLLQLQHIDDVLDRRGRIDRAYREGLQNTPGIRCIGRKRQYVDNFSYFPILINPEYPLRRDQLLQKLRDRGIHGRRYFYPLITAFPMYCGAPSADPGNLPVAAQAAERVLCLPIYPDLTMDDVEIIIRTIRDV